MAKNVAEQISKSLKKSKIKTPKIRKRGSVKKSQKKSSEKKLTLTQRRAKIKARSQARIQRFYAKIKYSRERAKKQKQERKAQGKRVRKETKEQKEKRLAKGYLTRRINKLKKEQLQSSYTSHLIKELEKNKENIDKIYKDIRKEQYNAIKVKEQFITDLSYDMMYYMDDDNLIQEFENVLKDKTNDQLLNMLRADDGLLFTIQGYPPTKYWHVSEEEQKGMREDMERTIRAFIQKYKD